MGLLDTIANGTDQFVNGAVNSPLFNLGLGLIGAGQPFANPAQQIQGAMQNMQAQRLAQQQVQQGQLGLDYQRAFNNAIIHSLNGGQAATAAPQAPAAPQPIPANGGLIAPAGQPAAPQNSGLLAPAGAPQQAAPAASQQPSWLAPPTQQDISSIPVGGLPASIAPLLAIRSGKDPAQAANDARTAQIASAKQQYDPIIQQLSGIVQSDDPVRDINANPLLAATWAHYAQQRGIDPSKGLNAANARQVFGGLANQYRSALGESAVAPPIPLEQVSGPGSSLGARYSRDPVTGEVKQEVGPQEVGNYIGPNGQIIQRTKAEAQAQGLTPYVPQTYVNAGTVDPMAQMIADYKSAPLTGFALRSPQGQAIMAEVRRLNPDYDATAYAAKVKARDAFATGKQGDTVRSLSVATSHLNQLSDLVDALGNKNLRVFNTLANAYSQETGGTAPTNFDTVKNIVADEVTKAILGYGGSVQDRDKAAAVIARSNSPAQLKSSIQQYLRLMGGQLDGLRRQYVKNTGLNDFDEMLSPQAQQQIEAHAPNSAAPPAGLPAGWTVTEH